MGDNQWILQPGSIQNIDGGNSVGSYHGKNPVDWLGEYLLRRLQYSVDYPWAYNANGTTFMEELRHSGLVTQSEWEGIVFGNAEKLLKL